LSSLHGGLAVVPCDGKYRQRSASGRIPFVGRACWFRGWHGQRHAETPIPAGELLSAISRYSARMGKIAAKFSAPSQKFRFPVFVSRTLGSSVGMTKRMTQGTAAAMDLAADSQKFWLSARSRAKSKSRLGNEDPKASIPGNRAAPRILRYAAKYLEEGTRC